MPSKQRPTARKTAPPRSRRNRPAEELAPVAPAEEPVGIARKDGGNPPKRRVGGGTRSRASEAKQPLGQDEWVEQTTRAATGQQTKAGPTAPDGEVREEEYGGNRNREGLRAKKPS